MKKKLSAAKDKVATDQEIGARKALLEELFNDMYRSRFSIYKVNFVRGIFFGLGSALGGTVVLAIVIWIVTQTLYNIPQLHDFMESTGQSLRSAATKQ